MLVLSNVLLWLVVCLNLLLTLALIRRGKSEQNRSGLPPGLEAGIQAPDFTAQKLNGEIVTKTIYIGKKTVFLFISTHCQPCRDLLPAIEELGKAAVKAGVTIVLVSNDSLEGTRAFVDEMSIQLPILVAPPDSTSFFKDYKVTATPSYCFVNEQGKVQSVGYPHMDWGEWKVLAESWKQDKPSFIGKGV